MEPIFSSWAGLASHFIGECFDCARPFIDDTYTGLDPLVRFVSAQLFIDCHLSSESVLLLVQAQKEWDADLISRAVMEGSLKFAYMLHGNSDEMKAKVEEYWNLLPQFFAIKRSERVKRVLEDLDNPDDPEWRPFRDIILNPAEIEQVRQRYPRQQRQMLEERWSFSGICRTFSQTKDAGLRMFVHLAHGYGMSSHLLHKDGDGIGMVWERYKRDPEQQAAVKLGHSARVVSDVCTFAKLRLLSLLRACEQHRPAELISKIEGRYEALLFAELAKASRHFTEVEYGAQP